MRLIDADAAIKDANLNYGGVYDAVLMKHFLERQPTIKTVDSGSEGCEACENKYCITCAYQMVDEFSEPCLTVTIFIGIINQQIIVVNVVSVLLENGSYAKNRRTKSRTKN